MKDKVEALLKQAKPEDQAELKLLYNAMVGHANAYQSDPTARHLKDWQQSKSALAEVVEKLQDKYSIGQPSADQETPEELEDIKAVLAYLHGKGYQISRAGIYNHLKDGKFSKDRKTGKFPVKKIDRYARNHLILAATGKREGDEAEALSLRKLKAETREREAKAQISEYELKIKTGKYIDREDMVRELVGRGMIIDSSFRHLVKSAVPDIIDLVGGDQLKAPQAMDELMTIVDDVMTNFANIEDFVLELQPEVEHD